MTQEFTSIHASAAQMLRKELKAKYPRTSFRLQSTNFSPDTNGSQVVVTYKDGPTQLEVEAIGNKYAYTQGKNDSLPQVKYVLVNHKITEVQKPATPGFFGWKNQATYTMFVYGMNFVMLKEKLDPELTVAEVEKALRSIYRDLVGEGDEIDWPVLAGLVHADINEEN